MADVSDYIPISSVELPAGTDDLVSSVLQSGQIAQGPMVQRLEREFAEFIGVRHVIAVSSGTAALLAALKAVGLDPGSEVITSPFTFGATLNTALATGATVRFADISEEDFAMRPDAVEDIIGSGTKVILPVHLFGQSADMTAIEAIANDTGTTIIEDAAQSLGATFHGRPVGTWGIGCFSLYATKNITSGEGGLVSTNDDRVEGFIRSFRNHGMTSNYEFECVGTNLRLTDVQAAVCLPQLPEYPRLLAVRKRNAEYLNKGLEGIQGLVIPHELKGRRHVWHQYTVLVTHHSKLSRDELAQRLREQGVGCGIYYPKLVFDHPCYRNDPRVIGIDAPVARSVSERCLSLPVHPNLSEAQLHRIIQAVSSLMTN